MRRSNRLSHATLASIIFAFVTSASAQGDLSANSYHYVADTLPPDDFLALRTQPSTQSGLRVMTLSKGALLEVLERKTDGWWYVRVVPSGEEGWALSGQGNGKWIECCKTGLNDPVRIKR
jgi:Bacterial SH3 domain